MTFIKHPAASTEVLDFVPPAVLHALRTASKNLTDLGIAHVICGGVAVGAYGYIRATKDVDFLVGDNAFIVSPSGIVRLADGVGFAVGTIPTDMVPLHVPSKPQDDLSFLESELLDPFDLDGMPLIGPEALVAMKLVAHRGKDLNDVVELLAAGATSNTAIRSYLVRHGREDLIFQLNRADVLDR